MKTNFLSLAFGLVFLAGCVPPEDRARTLPVVPGNPFGKAPATIDMASVRKSTDYKIADKVDWLGRELLAKNPQLKVAPDFSFCTIEKPNLEIFHVKNRSIYVTEGLVKRCQPNTDDLAAVLAQELGKIAAENLAAASAYDVADVDRGPPPVVNAGNDRTTDMVNLAQLLKYEKEKQTRRPIPPSPREQAQIILERAGYAPAALDRVGPLLEEADRNNALERQVKGLPSNLGWE